MLDRMSVELLKELDSESLKKLAGLVRDLQLEFGPAEGFQTAFRTLIQQAGKQCSSLTCALSARRYPDRWLPSAVAASIQLCCVLCRRAC